MDIPALSTMMSMERLSTNISFAMMSKVLDTAEVTGEVLTEMIDSIPVQGLGEHIDVLA